MSVNFLLRMKPLTLSSTQIALHCRNNLTQRTISSHKPIWCSCVSLRKYSWFTSSGVSLETSIKEAESLVGYTTTFNSWKYLFEEEPATFIGLARKIVGTGHPLLQTARDILSQDPHSSSHLGGLWVLLLSKAAGVNKHFDVSSNVVSKYVSLCLWTDAIK